MKATAAEDIADAGGVWRGEGVVVDDHSPNTPVTSRRPLDLPEFCDTFVRCFAPSPS